MGIPLGEESSKVLEAHRSFVVPMWMTAVILSVRGEIFSERKSLCRASPRLTRRGHRGGPRKFSARSVGKLATPPRGKLLGTLDGVRAAAADSRRERLVSGGFAELWSLLLDTLSVGLSRRYSVQYRGTRSPLRYRGRRRGWIDQHAADRFRGSGNGERHNTTASAAPTQWKCWAECGTDGTKPEA